MPGTTKLLFGAGNIPVTGSPGFRLLVALLLLPILAACAGYQGKEVDVEGYLARAISDSQGPITINAAVPTWTETEELIGIDLYDQGIQPVWLEVSNTADHPVRVALWSIDRDYFSPIEVAYMNRSGLSNEGEADMQRWFYENRLVRVIPPGETRSGFVYTHLDPGTKGFNVDVYGDRVGYNFTFFVPMPGFTPDYESVDFNNLYSEEQLIRLDGDDVRRVYQLINDLAICCSLDEKGTRVGEPLNLVFIGSGLALRRAMLRAGWEETEVEDPTTSRAREHHYRGRPPDTTFRKIRSDGSERKEIRLWLAPAKIDDNWVFMAQVSNDVAGAGELTGDFTDFHVDPDIDGARRYTTQNFWYSQSLARIGFAGGAGESSRGEPQQNFSGEDFFTDGMRAVMWLSETPVAMDDTIIENLLADEVPLLLNDE